MAWVRYPFLNSHPDHEIARRQMSDGSGMFAFGLQSGAEGATAMMGRLRLIRSGGNLAEVGSFICGSARLTNAVICPLPGAKSAIALAMTSYDEDAEDLVGDLLMTLDFA